MNILKKSLAVFSLGLALILSSASALAIPVTQLGFILDASGSVSSSNYNLMRSGLNSALAGLPTDSSVEITVVTYATGSSVVVAPTVLTAVSLMGIQSAITTHIKTGGGTNTGGGIDTTVAAMIGSANFADPGTTSLINLMTDGVPNSQSAAETASANAATAGIDALSIEAIGSGVSSATALANQLLVTFPATATILAVNETNISNPLGGSWVVPVSDFTALAAVLDAKVQASITPPGGTVPEPSTLALFAISLIGFGLSSGKRRRA